MARTLALSAPLWLLLARLCAANMQYTFTQNGTCPGAGRPFPCDPVDQVICGEETSRSWAYCCPVAYDYCSTGASECNGDNGEAGTGQIDCEAYGVKWCCSAEYETCTQRANQFNVCLYNKEDNPYVGFDSSLASKAWSSVVSTSPTATFNGDQITFLVAAASAAQSSASFSTTASPTPISTSSPGTSAPTSSSTSSADDHNGIPGGAIAGIVVGILAAVAIGAGALLFWRRRRSGMSNSNAGAYQPAPSSSSYKGQIWEGERKEAFSFASPPHELASFERRAELGTPNDERTELATNDAGPHEMAAR